jgi:hypothetical protein
MPSSTTTGQPTTEIAQATPEGGPNLSFIAPAIGAEWVSAVSYWHDYLTVIDVQGASAIVTREAS